MPHLYCTLKNFAKILMAVAVMTVLLHAGSAAGADATISIQDTGVSASVKERFDRQAREIKNDAAIASQSAADSQAVYFNLNKALGEIPSFDALDSGDQAFIRGAKKAYELYRVLGGESVNKEAVFQRQNNRFYVGFDGEGGRWLATSEEALSFLAKEIVRNDSTFPAAAKNDVLQCPLKFDCILLAIYTGQIKVIAYVPRDTTVTLLLTGAGFQSDPGPPVLLAPEGFAVHDVAFIDSKSIQVRLSVQAAAPLGLTVLSAFNEAQAFRSVGHYGVQVIETLQGAQASSGSDEDAAVLEGSGTAEALIDEHGNDVESAAALLGPVKGRLVSAADADLFKITLEQPGMLTVFTSGPTDVKGGLETAEGEVLATDDDGGDWYNFRIEKGVGPGTYYVRVTHCCAGTGAYRLTYAFVPD